ncbi:cyclin-K isoform X2 [Planococcus citri]|uniref:cyclin-K isoform X2 n=1 Tax=Planococcus citri TaxID=170843 RepID=UPI0031FA2096
MLLTACCALFLAGKVEETPKKAKDIIKMAEKCLPSTEFAKFGEDPKEELLVLERILLQSIKFDLQVDHPYAFLLKYAKSLKGVTSERQKMQDVLQMAWTFVNDSLCTTLCLQWEPEVIAVAMLYLAAKLSKYDINNWVGKTANQTRWWEMFVNGVTLELLEDICHQVLDLYSQKRPTSSASSIPGTNTSQTPTAASNNHSVPPPPPKPSVAPPKSVVIQPPPPTEPMATLPPTSVLPPPLANPIPNVSAMNNLYPPNSAVAPPPPPPQLFTVPPPGIPMNPPPSHDGAAPPYRFIYGRY